MLPNGLLIYMSKSHLVRVVLLSNMYGKQMSNPLSNVMTDALSKL